MACAFVTNLTQVRLNYLASHTRSLYCLSTPIGVDDRSRSIPSAATANNKNGTTPSPHRLAFCIMPIRIITFSTFIFHLVRVVELCVVSV